MEIEVLLLFYRTHKQFSMENRFQNVVGKVLKFSIIVNAIFGHLNAALLPRINCVTSKLCNKLLLQVKLTVGVKDGKMKFKRRKLSSLLVSY